jgi:uncharacterized RDD family membrane protein YckC
MVKRTPPSFPRRTIVTGLVALFLWSAFFIAPPLAAGRDASLFGLPLRAALAVPVALSAFVLIAFWFAIRQGREDEQFRDDG